MKANRLHLASYGIVLLFSVGVAAYAIVAYAVFPLGSTVHPDMRSTFESHRIGIYSHIFGAAVALLLGPLQFSRRIRTAYPKIHRVSGRIYLGAGVCIGGLAGFYMAMFAYGGLVSRVGFALLAIAWLYTGVRAYAAARVRDIRAHRHWMTRNFALALAAVTLRIYLGFSFAGGFPFEVTYPLVAWISWVPNLVFAEVLVRKDVLR